MPKLARYAAIAAIHSCIAFSGTAAFAQAGTWTSKPAMPTARSEASAVALDGRLHVIGGAQSGCSYLNTHEVYDPATNAWTSRAALPWGPDGGAAAVLDGVIYMGGGLTGCGTSFSNFAAFHPGTNSWSSKAPLSFGRGRFAMAAISGKVYAVGGLDSVNALSTLEAYDPTTNSWTTRAPMPTARSWFGAAAIDGILYVVGGATQTGNPVAAVEAYNPATNTWTTKAPLPTPRAALGVTVAGGILYAIGGGYNVPRTGLVEAYDPSTNTWSTKASMPTARDSVAAAALNDVIYAAGGTATAGPSQALEAYLAAPQSGSLALSATTLDFSAQSMGTTSPSKSLTLTNNGAATVAISSLAVSDPQFAYSGSCPTLVAGANCTLSVTFSPAAAAGVVNTRVLVSANLVVTSNAGNGTQTVALAGSAEKSLVTHYYRAILNRAPDNDGKTFWEGEAARLAGLGANINEVWFVMAGYFFNSSEYLAANRTNAQFVTDLYNTFFNRPPDTSGLGYWTNQMAGGLPREVVLFSFMFSPEFASFTQGIFGNTAARPEVNMVMDFFRGVLNRLPDTAGFNYWVNRFRLAQCAGAGSVYSEVGQISAQFIFNPEYNNRARNNTQYVTDMYYSFLRRGGDITGVGFWINQLNTNGKDRNTVRTDFIASPEFGARVQAIIGQNCLPPQLQIASVSSSSPKPLTALRVQATGVALGVAVSAKFANALGFSATLEPIQVRSDGMVIVPVPLYMSPVSNTIGAGTVTLTLAQGTSRSNEVTINIQDLPPLSQYGTTTGAITQAFAAFSTHMIARKLNQLAALQAAGIGAPDPALKGGLRAMLKASARAADDARRVALDGSLSLDFGAAPSGARLVYNSGQAAISDRIIGIYLTEHMAFATKRAAAKATPAELLSGMLAKMGTRQGRQDIIDESDGRPEGILAGLSTIDALSPNERAVDPKQFSGPLVAFYKLTNAMDAVMHDILATSVCNASVCPNYTQTLATVESNEAKLASKYLKFFASLPIAERPVLNLLSRFGDFIEQVSNFSRSGSGEAADDAAVRSVGAASRAVLRTDLAVIRGATGTGSGLDLCCFGSDQITLTGLADGNGDFEMVVPTRSPSTDYANIAVTTFDPLTDGTRTTHTLDLRGLAPGQGNTVSFTSCTFAVSTSSINVASTGGSGSITVTAPAQCTWQATSNASWLTIASGSSGSGNGAVSWSATGNPDATGRTATLTIAGKSVTVTQAATSFTPAPPAYNGYWVLRGVVSSPIFNAGDVITISFDVRNGNVYYPMFGSTSSGGANGRLSNTGSLTFADTFGSYSTNVSGTITGLGSGSGTFSHAGQTGSWTVLSFTPQ